MSLWMTAGLCVLGLLIVLFITGLLAGNIRLAAGVVTFAACLFMIALLTFVLDVIGV